jgi:hypothetical protein
MARNGILNFASPRGGGVLALGDPTGENAILGYLAGALQGGNLGQSIGRGLEGFLAGTRLDQQRLAPAQTYRALAAAGVPDPLARAAALNRDVMKAVMPAYVAPPRAPGAIGEGRRARDETPAERGAPDAGTHAAPDTAAVAALNSAIGRLGELMDPDTPGAADAAHSEPEPGTVAPGFPAEARSRASSTGYARERTETLMQALRASGIGEDDIRALQETLAAAPAPDAPSAVRSIWWPRASPNCKRAMVAAAKRRLSCSRPNPRPRSRSCGNGGAVCRRAAKRASAAAAIDAASRIVGA